MSRPNIGDLVIFNENGARLLAMVTDHGPHDTVDLHVFTTSHYTVHPSEYHNLTLVQEGKKKS